MKSIDDIAAALQGYDPQALSVDQVNAFLHELVQPVSADESQDVYLFDALGRVLAQDVISPISVPAHNNSAMDGFAFDAAQLQADQPLTLRVVGTALAGKAWQGKVNAGECLKIMTGAILPDGLDTVVPQEFCHIDNAHDVTTVTIPPNILKAGDNRRLLGEDLMQGEPALKAGQHLTPAALGLIASLGLPDVRVHRRLRVAAICISQAIHQLSSAKGCLDENPAFRPACRDPAGRSDRCYSGAGPVGCPGRPARPDRA